MLVLGLSAMAASGCAVNQATLRQYGDVQLDGHLLRSMTVTHSEPAQLGKLPYCVAANVNNDSIVVRDSAGSFVGAYTGNYYQTNHAASVGGGNVMQYVSPDASEVVAKGPTRYWAAMVERAVRFNLAIKDDGQQRTYKFTAVEVAQMNSGTWPNSGFVRAAMNPGAGGGHALKNMQQIANHIDACLR